MGWSADIPSEKGDSQAGLSGALSDLILSSIRDAVILTDAHGIVTYWNTAATQLFGWSADEMLGRPYGDRYPPD
ncbi:MAG TPA: PAS domain-containing protein, partial [Pseudomonadota bacterium]|nr:PAS domain-containing protein [Pseudomonadota bacterium]